MKENKFFEIYGSGENFSVGNWKKKINFINLLVEKRRNNFLRFYKLKN